MKLHEIKHQKKDGMGEKAMTVDLRNYGETKLLVKFHYEAPGSTRHGDDSSFDEDWPEQFSIEKVELGEDIKELDEYNEETGKVFKKGSDATKLPDWNDNKDTDAILDVLYGK